MSGFCYMINLKHYSESVGSRAEGIVASFSEINSELRRNLFVALSPTDLGMSPQNRNLTLMAQHVDPTGYGAFTGKISMESLAEMGIHGSLLNHSENRIPRNLIVETVRRSRTMEFDITLCVESLEEIQEYVALEPKYIAYEPPELIGGNISVSTARPEVIEKAAELCSHHEVPLIVGAGVKSHLDAEKSHSLGASGVLVASGVVKAQVPATALSSLMTIL